MKKTCFQNFEGHICGLPAGHTGEHVCAPCKIKQKKDQDGSFHPDPVAQMGECVDMYSTDSKKDLCSSGHFFSGSMDSCHGCGMDLKEATEFDEVNE
ncbi:MAG: hypothetical protein ACYCSO_05310 [Cuniculiplasma sp.]